MLVFVPSNRMAGRRDSGRPNMWKVKEAKYQANGQVVMMIQSGMTPQILRKPPLTP
jgi:hypothetical protein